MWLGACAALFGVFVGAMIRVWLDERRSDAELGDELAAPSVGLVGDTDAAGELDPADVSRETSTEEAGA